MHRQYGAQYIGKETKFITKLLKNSSIKISCTTNNTNGKALAPKPIHAQTHSRFEKSGVYQLTWPDCDLRYVGQTGRSFRVRFQENFQEFKYNNNKSKFAMHLLKNKHSIGHIDNIMEGIDGA